MNKLKVFPLGLWLLLGLLVAGGAWAGVEGHSVLLWLLVAVKAMLVSEVFMELGNAPWNWRLAVPVWILSVIAAVGWLLP